jgi:hypothetical protein
MAYDPDLKAHRDWLGYLQPVGVVVSPPALIAAQAILSRNVAPDQQRFLALVEPIRVNGNTLAAVPDFPRFSREFLGWEDADLLGVAGGEPLPPDLESVVPEYEETLRPTYAVRKPAGRGGTPVTPGHAPKAEAAGATAEQNGAGSPDATHVDSWLLLVQEIATGADFDKVEHRDDRHWQASAQARFERLLRETGVPTGLLHNGTHLRLVHAPRGETSGHVTFPVQAMTEVAGRPILAALQLLLSAERLFVLPEKQRLPALLSESRRYQAEVSTRLAEQVLQALYELLRGLQAADAQRHGDLLREILREDPDNVYAGLLTVLLRLIFLLYAEDRGLLSDDEVFVRHYAVTGLFERLREDAGRFPDTMDQRFGAWAQLIALFRLVHDGANHGRMRLPARHGHLFDPDRYPFLEGRPHRSRRNLGERLEPPLVPDGVVFRVLGKLLVLDGERLSYRALDVEQIGSVYEAMMGFHLEVARGPSIAIKAKKRHGAPATIDLTDLLSQKPAERAKWLKEQAEQDVVGQAAERLKKAQTPEEAVTALDRKVAAEVTPNIVPPGAMILQPSDERRRSGSHYTPRSLTGPIVQAALRPVLERLGERPQPEQVLGLRVCDPAMGSGAFLVETCRQLGDALVAAWHRHDCVPSIPPDEDEWLHARRQVAQRCLYGVDKNPLAVDLAKLSLWLSTLAREHPFTFLDHSLRHGDSLVGLTKQQIAAFTWKPVQPGGQVLLFEKMFEERIRRVAEVRRAIAEAEDSVPDADLRERLRRAEDELEEVRLVGDLVLVSFFGAQKEKEREARRGAWLRKVELWVSSTWDYWATDELSTELREAAEAMRSGEVFVDAGAAAAGSAAGAGRRALKPFHWEVEFPEVFERGNPGFGCVVGNPPFAGKNTTAGSNVEAYLDWLKSLHEESHGNADLVAHFFRRAFAVLRDGGTFGLIATNTIGQGDTRASGLRWICTHGGTIFSARRRMKWPGLAAVVVSIVHVAKGAVVGARLDGREVERITAYLFHGGGHENPVTLRTNEGKSFIGSYVLGMGFTFDDTDKKGVASPIAEMERLIARDRRNAERIFPYIGGEEVNDSPTHAHHRFVINFGQMTEEEARRWPDLMRIVEDRVRPARLSQGSIVNPARWWMFARSAADLFEAIHGMERVLAIARVSQSAAFTGLPAGMVYSEQLVVVALPTHAAFATLQSRPHELWARFFGSTLEDRLRYTPSDCFETFPFPESFDHDPSLEEAGRTYYDYRAALMVRKNEGLTKTYNRFHDPEERSPEILRLRELHDAMDRAVLDAYGWRDLAPRCEFLLDYDDEEEDDAGDARAPGRGRKKPWRYRWPDEVRDEVLARLLELNTRRGEEERVMGKTR